MISVMVERQPADKQGDDIHDPLLCAAEAAVERGRNEIDAASTNRRAVSLSGPYKQWTKPGILVEVQGRRGVYRGMVRRSALTIQRRGKEFTADMALELECEA